jgi:hypothetical protein
MPGRPLLRFDLRDTESLMSDENEIPPEKTCQNIAKKALTTCNTSWSKTSWLGIFTYTFICCLNYYIGRGIYLGMGWDTHEHTSVRIFGDTCTVGWFALGFIALPWHQWEQLTCIKTKSVKGLLRFIVWWAGTILAYLIYGYMGENPFFQTSLASDLSHSQKVAYGVVFSVIGFIVMYWFGKLCPCGKFKQWCAPSIERKVVFLRVIFFITLLFVVSYVLCSSEDTCTYHLHHWWFGFALIMISTTTLDNWFDYFLQGIFWTFLTESIFNYGITFGEFFI